MITQHQFMQLLSGRGTYEALVHNLYNQSADFPEDYRKYTEAIGHLRKELGDKTSPSVDMFVTAIEMQCTSDMLFAGFLGLKMNYDNYINPMQPNITWPQVDYEDAMRETLSRRLPIRCCAQKVIDDFYDLLTDEQKEIYYGDIRNYYCGLETSGPKIAHYYGYLIGNTLLGNIIPNYHDDPGLDCRYAHLLKEFFGKDIVADQFDGFGIPHFWKAAPIEQTNVQNDMVLREQVCRYHFESREGKKV